MRSFNADSLQGQTVMIIGASSGIGQAVAQASNQQGAHVILSSRSKDKLEAVRDSLTNPEQATVLPLDYLNREQVRTVIASLTDINHLVIPAVADENAKRSPFVEISDEVMRASFDKFWGQVYVTQAAAPKMQSGSSITLFSSVAAFRPPEAQSGLSVMNAVQGL